MKLQGASLQLHASGSAPAGLKLEAAGLKLETAGRKLAAARAKLEASRVRP